MRSLIVGVLAVAASGCAFDRGGDAPGGDVDAAVAQDDAAVGLPDAAVGDPVEMTVSITAAANDALQDPNGAVLVFYSWVSLYSSDHWGALRFALPGVEPGATIRSAYLELVIDSTSEDDPNMVMTTEASPVPAPLAAVSGNISNRVAGKARVSWQATGIGQGRRRSPLVTDLIQERVDTVGWPTGGDVLFLFDAGTTSNFEYRQVDHGTGADAARLIVTYVNP